MSTPLAESSARQIVWAMSGAVTPINLPIVADSFNPYSESLFVATTRLAAVRAMDEEQRTLAAEDEYDVCRTINDATVRDKRELRDHYEVLLGQVDDLPLTPEHSYAKANARARLRAAITEECDTTWEDKHEPVLRSGREWCHDTERQLGLEITYLRTRSADYEYDQSKRALRLEDLRIQLGGAA